MFVRTYSAALHGVDAIEVEIEVNESERGDPIVVIVGLPDTAVRESSDRVWTAMENSGFSRPRGRTTVNLAPADLRKEGPSFDLPIALGMIALSEEFKEGALEKSCIVGELALNGAIRPVKGVLSLAQEAVKRGRKALIVPKANAYEASLVKGIYTYGVSDLRQAVELLKGEHPIEPTVTDRDAVLQDSGHYEIDFVDVKGQASVKRAVEVAVAGGHNILMVGPPGTGKSMLAKRIPTIMPPMSEEEAIETTKIHSVCGLLQEKGTFLGTRPFRSPHHTISDVGLLGGSSNLRPGEISLAHNGVLFLDELPEFRRSTLEVLRQPLEDGSVTISRAAGTVTFPAESVLVCALNPCPCGFYGDLKRECRCSPNQIQKYRQRISGPLLDRIDIHVEVPIVEYKELSAGDGGEASEVIRQRVLAARNLQSTRFEGASARTNSAMPAKLMKENCDLSSEAGQLLEQAMNDLNFSARAHDRILKVARTIADLAESADIQTDHLLEAVQYRTLDRQLTG